MVRLIGVFFSGIKPEPTEMESASLICIEQVSLEWLFTLNPPGPKVASAALNVVDGESSLLWTDGDTRLNLELLVLLLILD